MSTAAARKIDLEFCKHPHRQGKIRIGHIVARSVAQMDLSLFIAVYRFAIT
jgi:hypothetical protein